MWDVVDTSKDVGSKQHLYQKVAGVIDRGRTPGVMQKSSMRTASAGQTERYNVVRDSLNEGSVVEDWIPRDPAQINNMMRLIYIRDEIAGPTTDLFSELPWSECQITGLRDPKIRQFYEDWLSCMDPRRIMPELTTEYLVPGRAIANLSYNDKLGYWDNVIIQDPNNIKIDPIPVHGVDPKLDLKLGADMQRFLQSTDPRDMDARKKIAPKLLKELEKGGGFIPLDPLNTLFLPRRAGANDLVGTSFYTRLLTWWALQKPLINASAIGARRKAGGTTLVTVGKEGSWEPTPSEMSDVSRLFIQAEEDPISAVVVMREGVNAQRLDSNQGIWKLSDDYAFIAEGKMKALGINDAFLSGDANFTTMESALSVLLERIKTLRSYLTYMVLHRKAIVLARVHGYRKRKDRDASGSNTPAVKLSEKESLNIPLSELELPHYEWTKKLQPVADENYLQILDTMEQKGLPVSLRQWANAGGVSIQELNNGLDEDAKLRKKYAAWSAANQPQDSEGDADEGGQVEASVASFEDGPLFRKGSVDELKHRIPVWDHHEKFMGLKFSEFRGFVKWLRDNPKYISNRVELIEAVKRKVGTEKAKVLAMKYVLARAGVYPLKRLSLRNARLLVGGVVKSNRSQRESMREIAIISALSTEKNTQTREAYKKADASMSSSIKRRFGLTKLPSDKFVSGYSDADFDAVRDTFDQ